MVSDRREGVALQLVEHAADAELALAKRQHEPPQLRRGAAGSLLLQIQRVKPDPAHLVIVLPAGRNRV